MAEREREREKIGRVKQREGEKEGMMHTPLC